MKKILVIGGGFAGSTVAKALERDFDVTLVDSKDYFEFTPGVLRTLVQPSHLGKIQAMHTHYLKRAWFIRSEVKELRQNEAVLSDGKKIAFDYAVICSGSHYAIPIKEEGVVIATRSDHLRNASVELKKSDNIVLIGGGLVAVELAAEIACIDKNVSIIQSKDRLLERQPEKSSTYAERFLKRRGVQIFYNELAQEKKGKTIRTDKGTHKADLVFWCTGITPNFEFMKRHFGHSLTEKGYVKVLDTLQLKDASHIFAAGDITDRVEEKTAQNAKRQAAVVIKNILAMDIGASLSNYVSKVTPIVLSLGKYDGILVKENSVWTGLLPAFLKAFVEWREMRLYQRNL